MSRIKLSEVKHEVSKVTWPSRQETTVSTIMVIIMTVLAALFFMVVDAMHSWIMGKILGLGG